MMSARSATNRDRPGALLSCHMLVLKMRTSGWLCPRAFAVAATKTAWDLIHSDFSELKLPVCQECKRTESDLCP